MSVHLSVYPPSVTRQSSVETANHIIKLFQRGVATPLQLFRTKCYGRFRQGPPNGGVECRRYEKTTIFVQYLVLSWKWHEDRTTLLWNANR